MGASSDNSNECISFNCSKKSILRFNRQINAIVKGLKPYFMIDLIFHITLKFHNSPRFSTSTARLSNGISSITVAICIKGGRLSQGFRIE